MVITLAGCTVPTFAPNGAGEDSPATGGGSATASPGTGADWRDCDDVPRELVGRGATGMQYDCAEISVPRDWNDPQNGETYAISVIRIRSASQKNRIGSL